MSNFGNFRVNLVEFRVKKVISVCITVYSELRHIYEPSYLGYLSFLVLLAVVNRPSRVSRIAFHLIASGALSCHEIENLTIDTRVFLSVARVKSEMTEMT